MFNSLPSNTAKHIPDDKMLATHEVTNY